ncbi:MAG: GH92 family glycosyl hydrolase, partial [Sphingobacterium sp.]
FRSLFPFLNLMYPEVSEKMQDGLANAYREGGWLPEWASPGYRNIMVGNNSASVVADAWVKGIKSKDIETLYEAVKKGANNAGPITAVGRAGADYYNELGYVPYDVDINENAARSLEYAYDDFSIYQLAKSLGKEQADLDFYKNRSFNYKKLFDPSTGLMRGKNKDGSWSSPFSPFKWGDAFTEGNSWHYSWSVFQDIQGLAELMGGNQGMEIKLDSVFSLPPIFDDSYYGFPIHEIREMQIANMGQYAHGNQPIQHMIYLYNHVAAPWKTQYWVRETMNRMYSPNPDGYCGDEDNGQTSAWYVFSAIGFYPVTPASDEYVIGSPIFDKVTLHLSNGKKVNIQTKDNSDQNRYIQSMKWNGKKYTKNFLNHSELIKGANLSLDMGSEPNKNRGVNKADLPYSLSKDDQ